MPITTAYFDRSKSSIEGLFTVKTVDIKTLETITIFEKLPARSGQRGFERTSWVRGKSPIPFGSYFLWLRNPLQKGEWAGDKGIGEFYRVSSSKENSRLIQHESKHCPHLQRWDIGIHPDNNFPGSAGCLVLVNDTDEQKGKILELREYIKKLAKQETAIRLVVL